MARSNRKRLAERVAAAAAGALDTQGHVGLVDVMVAIGWLDPDAVRRWQQGRVGALDSELRAGPPRVLEARRLFRTWAEGRALAPSETHRVARTPQRQALRFSASGDAEVERLYRARWVPGALSGRERARIAEKVDRPPELVVVSPLNTDWTCHRCGAGGALLMMEPPGPACLRCVGLDDLEFLPSGDAALTRRAKARSARHAVVVRFSRRRRRYERQGLLVEPQALSEAQRGLDAIGAATAQTRR